MTGQPSATESSNDGPVVPQWCTAVIWADIAILSLAGLASLPGLFRMIGSGSPLALLGGVLLCSKVVVGLWAGWGLLNGRALGQRLAYIAVSVAVIGGLFSFLFVQTGSGVSQETWVYAHRSTAERFLFVWGVGWNLMYLVASTKFRYRFVRN